MNTYNNMERHAAGAEHKFFQSDESLIFVMGSAMLVFWVASVAVLLQVKHQLWNPVITMGLAHIAGGRAASVFMGMKGMHLGLVAFLAVYFDVMILFIVYPILIFSYHNFLERKFFREHMQPIFDSAQKSIGHLRGFKIAGIFFFVWFPFWMTGIIVGAVIGYVLGLRTWVTMITVILGTTCAILTWVFVSDVLFKWLEVHKGIQVVASLVIILILALLRFRSWRKQPHYRGA